LTQATIILSPRYWSKQYPDAHAGVRFIYRGDGTERWRDSGQQSVL